MSIIYNPSREDLLKEKQHLVEELDRITEERNDLRKCLYDATLHFTQQSFSARPCSTCEYVSKLIGKPFGCVKLRKE